MWPWQHQDRNVKIQHSWNAEGLIKTVQPGSPCWLFSDLWNRRLISPIYKSGDKIDPNNYRGMCVSSNQGEVFCCIINAHIQAFLTNHSVLNKRQIGFLPNHHTTDYIYTLHTLIKQHVHQKKQSENICMFYRLLKSIWLYLAHRIILSDFKKVM